MGPQARLDLRGKRHEEAMNELDAFIDQALLSQYGSRLISSMVSEQVSSECDQYFKETNMSRVSVMPTKC